MAALAALYAGAAAAGRVLAAPDISTIDESGDSSGSAVLTTRYCPQNFDSNAVAAASTDSSAIGPVT